MIDLTIERLEEELDPDSFFRTNRSTVIHINAIRKFESHFGGKLVLRLIQPFDRAITISRLKATEFKKWIGR
ncbi:LytTR family DNA-binding domain-containing protein [uncultured Sunxiuqinia sp.]|uniref:LytTR family DNA-binding domain-containing protein n=1 Tax=uncultured Sunxiuqinia sp. TaxID=1573825 RepID=UPI002AA71E30|nr:LytTR family DNA-binding domain-containing protein [uncultured Sunxiuqinia sp.]